MVSLKTSQVLDTVNLYTSEDHKRKLSLRFLSWFLLKKDIQTASHDSIEDARYALLLYKLWKDFKRDDRLSDVMDDIFFEGHKLVSSREYARADNVGFQTAHRS
jgi:PAB-dependent poly(A)-specific ribonuclease subunit 2